MLELLQNESTLAEIAMEPSKAVKEYKEELIKSQEQNERLTALVGKVTVEKEWLALCSVPPRGVKKLKSLGSSLYSLTTSAVKRSFCSCDLISSSLYSLTALDGSIRWAPISGQKTGKNKTIFYAV